MRKQKRAISIIVIILILMVNIPLGYAASNSCKLSNPTISGLTQTNAILNSSVTWSGTKPSQVGFYLGKSTNNMIRAGYDTILPNTTNLKFWYNLNTECKLALSPNTMYYCRPYVVQSGKFIWGSTLSFKTPAITASFASTSAASITQNTAQISSSLTYNSSIKPSKVGMYLEYGNTRKLIGTDTSLPNTLTFKFWYNLTGLASNTKYTFQPFAVINGLTFYGSKASFTTASPSSPSAYQWPIKVAYSITSGYGPREPIYVNGKWTDNYHNGIDLASGGNMVAVYPIQDGAVVTAKYDSIGGNYIVIKHSNGWYSYYGHLSKMLVKAGDAVKKSTQIGVTGKTGSATGIHLHLTVAKSSQWWVNSQCFDPRSILP